MAAAGELHPCRAWKQGWNLLELQPNPLLIRHIDSGGVVATARAHLPGATGGLYYSLASDCKDILNVQPCYVNTVFGSFIRGQGIPSIPQYYGIIPKSSNRLAETIMRQSLTNYPGSPRPFRAA